MSFAKQLALEDFLGKHSWKVDIPTGTVDFGKQGLFGKRRVFPIQLLGTEAESDGCFMWAWANTQSNLPAAVLAKAESLRQWGEANGVPELTQRKVPLADWSGHELAMLATGRGRRSSPLVHGPWSVSTKLAAWRCTAPPEAGPGAGGLRANRVLLQKWWGRQRQSSRRIGACPWACGGKG